MDRTESSEVPPTTGTSHTAQTLTRDMGPTAWRTRSDPGQSSLRTKDHEEVEGLGGAAPTASAAKETSGM